MKKKYILNIFNLAPFIMAFGCTVVFNLNSYVAADGTLVEPFFLVPISILLILVGVIGIFARKRY